MYAFADDSASDMDQDEVIACTNRVDEYVATSKKHVAIPVDSECPYNSDFSISVSDTDEGSSNSNKPLKPQSTDSIVDKSVVDLRPARPTRAAIDIVKSRERDLDPEEYADDRSLRNSVADDHLLDYLNKFGASQGYTSDSSAAGYDPDFEFNFFVGKKQNEFQMRFIDACCKRLNQLFPMGFSSVLDNRLKFPSPSTELPFMRREDIFSKEIAQATLMAMRHGVPLIARPILHNHARKMCHAPDLLVRSDVLVHLFENVNSAHLANLIQAAPKLLTQNFHYVIVNIRFCQLHLKAAGVDYLENNSSMKFYKIQTFAQNSTLGLIQGYLPQEAYIAGHGWFMKNSAQGSSSSSIEDREMSEATGQENDEIDSNNNNNTDDDNKSTASDMGPAVASRPYRSRNCFDRVGIVDCLGGDVKDSAKYSEVIADWLEWFKQLHSDEAKLWRIEDSNPQLYQLRPGEPFRPSIGDLYPNMTNQNSFPWCKAKKQIAEKLKEITALPECGVTHRRNAHAVGIYRYDDPRLTAQLLGFGKRTGNTGKEFRQVQGTLIVNRDCSLQVTAADMTVVPAQSDVSGVALVAPVSPRSLDEGFSASDDSQRTNKSLQLQSTSASTAATAKKKKPKVTNAHPAPLIVLPQVMKDALKKAAAEPSNTVRLACVEAAMRATDAKSIVAQIQIIESRGRRKQLLNQFEIGALCYRLTQLRENNSDILGTDFVKGLKKRKWFTMSYERFTMLRRVSELYCRYPFILAFSCQLKEASSFDFWHHNINLFEAQLRYVQSDAPPEEDNNNNPTDQASAAALLSLQLPANPLSMQPLSLVPQNRTKTTAKHPSKKLKAGELHFLDTIGATDPVDIVIPKRISNNVLDWRKPGQLEFYVDLETTTSINDNFIAFPNSIDSTLITMIGCAHVDRRTGKLLTKVYICNALTMQEEARIINEWLDDMDVLAVEYQIPLPLEKQVKTWHWSKAEPSFFQNSYNSAVKRHNNDQWKNRVYWCDFLEVMTAEPIVIRGAMGNGLKAVGKALNHWGKIDVLWKDAQVDSGLNAMIAFFYCQEQALAQNCWLSQVKLMDEISGYNRIDVECMYAIIEYFRKNHA